MKTNERIETERLVLRKPRLEDAQEMYDGYARDPDVTRYLTWRPHRNLRESQDILRLCLASWSSGEVYSYALTLKTADSLIGMIAVHPEDFKTVIGYVLAKPYWGRGYMTEAVRAVIDWAFRQPEIYRVYATTDVDNAASRRVLEKAGLRCEGILRRYILHPNISDEPRDSYMYAIVK